jgi:alkylation response protein AidB-like acyl-CoA dehydrogenase
MDFRLPAEVDEFRDEFRAYLDGATTPALLEELASDSETTGPLVREFWRDMGRRGYLGLGWPKEYGGGGRSALFLWAFNFEMGYRGLPTPLLGLNTVGPALIRVGSEEQKREYLPRILNADVEFAIGYTEPDAGTDLASLKTTAVRDGDEWVINGRKVFTSNAHQADVLWMAVRTDTEAPKHRGISIILVPLDTPGIEVQPFHTTGGGRTNLTFYDNVRVPLSNLVGEENLGWRYITTQLDFERVAISPVPEIARVFDTLVDMYREDGLAPGEEWTRVHLAQMAADLNMLRWLDQKIAAMVARGEVPVAEASMIKVMSNELKLAMLGDALQMLGPAALVRFGQPDAVLDQAGRAFETTRRGGVVNLFGGGSNDVQRDLMGFHGLRLPR